MRSPNVEIDFEQEEVEDWSDTPTPQSESCLGCHTLPEDNPLHTHNSKAKDDWEKEYKALWKELMPVAHLNPSYAYQQFKELISNLLTQQKEDERNRILEKIAEYEYHKDEVHCTCLNALKQWIENDRHAFLKNLEK